ncbi:RNA helicase [Sterolibacterium denitrificans]|uniref:DEAD-box ATP-dependent RNA helicase RhpA n=1 Tax=Sterolibacterium denitrificans TaxID=157592 RepID=A0A7Z7MWA1_9PROT|nr:DEAD/DEAH box helicase [Sterolibacterium denitrificans]SMB29214.1 RNA helicase [Sterolibacterium denitrificans]
MKFEDLGLMPELLQAVADAGYSAPTPIQAQSIPIILAGKDILGGAQTGTGKTASFTLPMLQRIARHANTSSSPARHPVRALILAPTRELAMQVFENVKTYSKHLPLRSTCLYGGVDIKPQIAEMMQGREIIVATPGRLLDHVQQKTVSFNAVEFLILDEADRMLDMGFIPDIKRILALLPKERQSLLFSATFSEEIRKLADTMLKSPQLIEVARRNAVSETITHRVYPVAQEDKRHLLVHLLREQELRQVLVFVGTKFGASRLAHYLQRQGIEADAIHGDKSQQQRTEALEAFKAGRVKVLVGTDVAARGLDIDDLPHVINYELPHVAEDYVHRIGRTGRAGKPGDATSLVSPAEKQNLAEIEKLIKIKIEQVNTPGFELIDDQGHTSPDAKGGRARSQGRARDEFGASAARESRQERSRKTDRERAAENLQRRPSTEKSASPHLPKLDFDPSKPYESRPDPGKTNQPSAEKPNPRRAQRPVAALLGGLGKKKDAA